MNMSKAMLYHENLEIKKVLKMLDDAGDGVVAFVDETKELVGIVTDGDMRKGLLDGKQTLGQVINFNPITANTKMSKTVILNLLKRIHRRHIPLIDENNKFYRIFSMDEVDFNLKTNWVVIMAGGLGTRLGELTKDTPKPMLPVRGKPILETIIERFVSYGFTNFYIAVNYKKEIIKDYFKEGNDFGINIRYLEEDKRLGTAGALSLIPEGINEPVIVSNGDVITSVNIEELLAYHLANDADATMCIREHEHSVPYGVVEVEGDQIIGLNEKPKILVNINTGIYVLNPDIIQTVPKDVYYDMPTVFGQLVKDNKRPMSYKVSDYWVDVGRVADYEKVNNEVEL